MNERPQVEITSPEQLRDWLEANADTSDGVWLVRHKKASKTGTHVSWDQIVDEAICFGWIDGQARPVDADRSQQLLTPRGPKSKWSRINKGRVERLTVEGRMRPAGLAAVELARQTGSWTALDDIESLIEPEDLTLAFDADPEARRNWNAFPRSAKRVILEWVYSAKRRKTRERRVRETTESAARNVRAHQSTKPRKSPPREQ